MTTLIVAALSLTGLGSARQQDSCFMADQNICSDAGYVVVLCTDPASQFDTLVTHVPRDQQRWFRLNVCRRWFLLAG